jgi:hypothetical protein
LPARRVREEEFHPGAFYKFLPREGNSMRF